jgi:hypothetical protein
LVADLSPVETGATTASDAGLPSVLTKTGFRAIAVIFEN